MLLIQEKYSDLEGVVSVAPPVGNVCANRSKEEQTRAKQKDNSRFIGG